MPQSQTIYLIFVTTYVLIKTLIIRKYRILYKNFNKTIYKEYCQVFPENNVIQEKLNQFQEKDMLSLKIDVKTDRYISNNEILDIILRKSLTEYQN